MPGRAAIENDFPILSREVNGRPLVYLDNATTTQKPLAVLDAVRSFYCTANGSVHRSAHSLNALAASRYEAARETVRTFLGARCSDEIIFTRGTTESLNLVAHGLGEGIVGQGDTVIVTELEHHSNLLPWFDLCRRKGAELLTVPLDENGRLCLEHLDELFDREPKILSIAHVSNALGTVNPVKRIIERAHDSGCLVVVDGAQAVAHLPVNVQDLDCDFYAFSGHKLHADTGIGVLFGKEHLLESINPWQLGGGMVTSVDPPRVELAELPRRLEAGTPNIAGAIGLAAAINYLSEIGLSSVHRHMEDLHRGARERVAMLRGAEVYGPEQDSLGLVSFNLIDVHHYDAASMLDKMGVAVASGAHCAQPVMKRLGRTGTIRASLALYNDDADIEALIEGTRLAYEIFG